MNKRNSRFALVCIVIAAILLGVWLSRAPKPGAPSTAKNIANVSHATDRNGLPAEFVPDRARVERPDAPSRSQTGVLSSPPNLASVEPGPRAFGRVVMRDSEDVPVAGAQVVVYFTSGATTIRKTAVSDADGAFQIGGLVPGNGFQISAVKDRLFSAPRADDIQFFQVKPEEQRVGPLMLRMVRCPMLALRVTSEVTKAPLADAVIEYYLGESRKEITGPAGEAQLTLTPESWNLGISAEGHERLRRIVDLSSGKDVTLDVALKAGGGIHGVITSENGESIKDASVFARIDSLSQSAKADATGAYTIGGLPLSKDLTVSAYYPSFNSGKSPSTKKIKLTPEQPSQRVDFVLPARPLIGSGLAIKGLVTDEDKKPIPHAIIMYGDLVRPGPDNYAGADGKFLITGIDPKVREKSLTVFNEGYQPERVSVEAGPPDNPPEVTVVLQKGHWVDGRVVDAGKRPIANVRMTPFMFNTPIRTRAFSTGADGRFHFDSLTDSTTFDIRANGYSEKSRQAIELDKKDVEFVLLETGIIAGNVLDEATGQPVKSFVVKLNFSNIREPGDDTGFGLNPERMTTGESFNDEAGKFVLRALNSNVALALSVEAEGYAPRFIERAVAKPESEAKPIEVKLKKEGAAIQGVIVGGDSKPVPNADVMVLVHKSKDRTQVYFDWPSILRDGSMAQANYAYAKSIKSSAEGIFLFDNIPEEHPIDIVVMAEGFANTRVEKLEALSEDERLKVVVNLQKAARVHGKINREKFPKALWVELRVQTNPMRLGEENVENSDEYKIERVSAGKLVLTLSGRGVNNSQGSFNIDTLYNQSIEVAEGQDLEVNIEGTAGYKVSGVVKIGGRPLAGGMVEIHIQVANARTSRSGTTDHDGRFAIESVEPGAYEFVAAIPDPKNPNRGNEIYQSPYKLNFDLGEADLDRDFLFDKLANLRGRILNSPTAMNLSLSPKNPQAYASSFRGGPVQPSGAFLIEGVAPGEYRLSSYSNTGGSRLVQDNIVMPGGGADLDLGDINLEGGGTIRATFVGDLSQTAQSGLGIFTTPPGNSNPGYDQIASAMILAGTQTATIEHHPAGRFVVGASGLAHVTDPPTQEVEVVEGQTAEVSFSVRAVTAISFDGLIGQADVVSVTATPKIGGQPVTFVRKDPKDAMSFYRDPNLAGFMISPQNPANPSSDRMIGVFGRGLAPGAWEFTVIASNGKKWSTQVELKAGEMTQGQISLQ